MGIDLGRKKIRLPESQSRFDSPWVCTLILTLKETEVTYSSIRIDYAFDRADIHEMTHSENEPDDIALWCKTTKA